jgi:hypothetical protein
MYRKFITIYALLHLTFSHPFTASFAADVDVDTCSGPVPYSPVNLLERLTQEQRKIPEFHFSDYVKNWITLADVQKLALRLDSKRKCLHVADPWSSERLEEYSTEGVEAAQLIKGYIDGSYPVHGFVLNKPAGLRVPGGSPPVFHWHPDDWKKNLMKEVRTWLRQNNIPTKAVEKE